MKVAAIIPCRYGASRFPGKSLVDIAGKPMFWHVHQRALQAKSLTQVIVATDDDRIRKACEIFDIDVVMTRSDHVSGTDRVAECALSLDADVIVNVQGDEPMIDPEAIERVARAMIDCTNPLVQATNGFNEISTPSDAIDANVVKVIMSSEGMAMAYSRLPIPYPRGGEVQYHRQLGLYAFRPRALELFSTLSPGPIERAEGVEMLRFVEHGHQVQMVQVPNDDGIPVDTPADLARVRARFGSHA